MKTSRRKNVCNLYSFSIHPNTLMLLRKPIAHQNDLDLGIHVVWDYIFEHARVCLLVCFPSRQGKRLTSCRVLCGLSWMEPSSGSRIRRLWTRGSSASTLSTTATSSGPIMPGLSVTSPRNQSYVSSHFKIAIQFSGIWSQWLCQEPKIHCQKSYIKT